MYFHKMNKEDQFQSLPRRQTRGSVGYDITSTENASTTISPGKSVAFRTGIRLELPQGIEAQIRSRSGMAFDYSVFVLNSPGTIDSDYKGEIKVLLTNLGTMDYVVNRGDRIAQIVFSKIEYAPEDNGIVTERGGGFGSTGI